MGVVIIVQFLAADQDTPRHDVGGCVGRLEIAIAPVMSRAIDDARRCHRYPDHLHRPDGDTDRPEQQHIYGQHQGDAQQTVLGIQVALQPVVRRAAAVFFQRFKVFGFLAIKLRPFQQYLFDADNLRTVWIVRGFAFCMVLAVDRSPFLGDRAGGEPQPEAEEMAGDRMQLQRAMCLVAVQKNGHRCNGDVGERQCGEYIAPPRQIQ